ncbi:hypothetical protein H4V98_002678 [Polaromonas sp. CG_23.6]|nr:hypothetical protein [Polaromonas sp. CG_23.6]
MATNAASMYAIPPLSNSLKDYVNGALVTGSITGTVKTKAVSGEPPPTYCRVVLLRDIDLVAVRSMWTDPVTGAYQFSEIDKHLTYTVIAIHPTTSFRAVIADHLTPE